MNQGNYSTTGQTMGLPVLDLTNPQSPTYISAGGQIRSLSPACYRISVKNTITISAATIVVCTGTDPSTCAEPASCPATYDLTIPHYYNFQATVTAQALQSGVTIEFDYLYNDTPVVPPTNQITGVTVSTTPTTVTLFATNHPLGANDTVTLYGARVV